MMKKIIRKITPRKIINLVGFYNIFFRKRIHHKIKDNFYKDEMNEFLPWFTYPCIEFLKTLNIHDKKVLEFGSGSSTLFWSKKCDVIYSVEKNKSWYKKILKKKQKNINLYLSDNETQYSNIANKIKKKFDIIVIDGAARKSCLVNSLGYLNPDGMIIFDNIEWYPNSAEFLRKKQFTQLDFSGFSPLNSFESCTSIFFKKTKIFKKRNYFKNWHPIGGRYLKAYDD